MDIPQGCKRYAELDAIYSLIEQKVGSDYGRGYNPQLRGYASAPCTEVLPDLNNSESSRRPPVHVGQVAVLEDLSEIMAFKSLTYAV